MNKVHNVKLFYLLIKAFYIKKNKKTYDIIILVML